MWGPWKEGIQHRGLNILLSWLNNLSSKLGDSLNAINNYAETKGLHQDCPRHKQEEESPHIYLNKKPSCLEKH